MKAYDVVALGELLIDFTENGLSEQGNPLLEANPGGAPCNVLAMLRKLGRRTAFIGKVGQDLWGERLKKVVEEVGIDTRNLLMDPSVRTTLAFVSKKPNGDRDFAFYRNPGADMMLCAGEVQEELIADCRIFHFGSLSMTHPLCREATREAQLSDSRATASEEITPSASFVSAIAFQSSAGSFRAASQV